MVAEEAPGASALNATFEDFVWVTDDEIIASVVPEDAGERPQVQSHPQYHCVCVLPLLHIWSRDHPQSHCSCMHRLGSGTVC